MILCACTKYSDLRKGVSLLSNMTTNFDPKGGLIEQVSLYYILYKLTSSHRAMQRTALTDRIEPAVSRI